MRYVIERGTYTLSVPRKAASIEELMATDDAVCDDKEFPYENHYVEYTARELIKNVD